MMQMLNRNKKDVMFLTYRMCTYKQDLMQSRKESKTETKRATY